MDIEIIVAWVGAAAALIVALLGWLQALRIHAAQQSHDERLRTLDAKISEAHAERDARREYEYEARKRLYRIVEPLLFEYGELAENAANRIRSLARTGRKGHLGRGPKSWIASEGYYFLSTLYSLAAPLGMFRLIRSRMTLVDLTVDPGVRAQYALAKLVYKSVTDDYKLAAAGPNPDGYDPHEGPTEGPSQRTSDKQALVVGRRDRLADSLVVDGNKGRARIVTFGEFEDFHMDPTHPMRAAFEPLARILRGFHPRDRSIFWRILIAQCLAYEALLRIRDARPTGSAEIAALVTANLISDRGRLDWRQKSDRDDEQSALDIPLSSAEAYFRERFRFRSDVSGPGGPPIIR